MKVSRLKTVDRDKLSGLLYELRLLRRQRSSLLGLVRAKTERKAEYHRRVLARLGVEL